MDLILFAAAMILPGAVLAMAVDTARVLWRRRQGTGDRKQGTAFRLLPPDSRLLTPPGGHGHA